MIEEETKTVTDYSYTVLFEPPEEGGFVVTCPALPWLVTEGDTLEEARAMAEDAIRGYMESLRQDDLPIPSHKARVERKIRLVGYLNAVHALVAEKAIGEAWFKPCLKF